MHPQMTLALGWSLQNFISARQVERTEEDK